MNDTARPRLYNKAHGLRVFIMMIIDMRLYYFIVILMNAFAQSVHQCKIPYVFHLNSHDQLRKYTYRDNHHHHHFIEKMDFHVMEVANTGNIGRKRKG